MSTSLRQTWITALCVVTLSAVWVATAHAETGCDNQGLATVGSVQQSDPGYEGKPLSYWMKIIRDRDERMPIAFEAIQSPGALAWPAVPLLEAIVAEPFAPIKVGGDENDVVLSKLLQIQLRADAIDGLAAIGPAAECSVKTLIHWALTVRVIPVNVETPKANALFVEIVGIDVLERLRVAGTVPELGRNALATTASLLTSSDGEKRKMAVAILAERTLPIAVSLLKSRDCDEKSLGLTILEDMWPVVPEVHLFDLKKTFVCDTN